MNQDSEPDEHLLRLIDDIKILVQEMVDLLLKYKVTARAIYGSMQKFTWCATMRHAQSKV